MLSDACIRRNHTYWSTCPCDDCARGRVRTHKLYSMGRRRAVTHDQAWAIIAARFEAGWTARALASACGLDADYFSRHLARWRRGDQVYIGPLLAETIVNMGRPTDGQIGAEPSRRRLRALAAIGHGLNTLVIETGLNFSTLAAIRSNNERVGARVANIIADTYERLHMTPGDDEQAARMAREKGWAAPMAWDDIETDAQPIGHQYVTADRAQLIRDMTERGDNLTHAARALHLSPSALERWCRNHGLADEYRTLAGREGDWNDPGNYAHPSRKGTAA